MEETKVEERNFLEELRSSIKKVDIRIIVPEFDMQLGELVNKIMTPEEYAQLPWLRYKGELDKFPNQTYEFLKDEDRRLKREFLKEIKNNRIEDEDKVYFFKSSTFPKLSFNRYSDKASKVNSLKTADKIVIGENIKIERHYSWRFTYFKSKQENCIYLKVSDNRTHVHQYLDHFLSTEAIQKDIANIKNRNAL